jgi:hypothetical protein
LALYTVRPVDDWVTLPTTTIRYGESLIGADGRIDDATPAAVGRQFGRVE